jgi:hypothetical protein
VRGFLRGKLQKVLSLLVGDAQRLVSLTDEEMVVEGKLLAKAGQIVLVANCLKLFDGFLNPCTFIPETYKSQEENDMNFKVSLFSAE